MFSLSIGDLIKQLRKGRGLTQKQLSSLSGVAQSAISQAESNMREPGFDVLQRLCKAFNLSVSAFFSLLEENELPHMPGINEKENDMLTKYRLLSESDKKLILSMINSLFEKKHNGSGAKREDDGKNMTAKQNPA